MKNSMTKDRAKEKAQNLRKILESLGHDIGIRHCYEILARTNGYESWNAMSANLESDKSQEISSAIDLTHKLEVGFNESLLSIGEGEKVYDFEVMANAKVKRNFIVRGPNAGRAYTFLEEHIRDNEASIFSGEDWEVDGNIGMSEMWNINLGYFSGLHENRNIAPVTITSYDNEEEITNSDGISWQSVQSEK